MKTQKSVIRRVDKNLRRRKRSLGAKAKKRNLVKHRTRKKVALDHSLRRIVSRMVPGITLRKPN